MSKIKNMLNSELEHYEYNGDIEAIKNSGSNRQNHRKKLFMFISSFIFIFITISVMLLIPNFSTGEKKENNSSVHSFFIVASALDSETKEPLIKTTNIPKKDIIIPQTRFACTYYVHGNEKYQGNYEMGDEKLDEIFAQDDLTIYKSFTGMGDGSIWIEGENIAKVEYFAENGEMYDWADMAQNKTITIEDAYGKNKEVSWLPPTQLITWMEKENTTNKPVDFSKAPQDTITITATYTDGSTATRKLKLYYNQYGYLVVETEDGTKYNDGDLDDYKKWKSNVSYNENGEDIAWDYNGRANDES